MTVDSTENLSRPGYSTIILPKIYKWLFATLIFIICSDINNLFSKYFGTEAFLSVPILVIIVGLMIGTFSRKMFVRSNAIIIFYILFAWFLIYGSFVSQFVDFSGQDIGYRWRYYLPAVLLLLVTIKLCDILIRSGQFDWLINVYTSALLFNCVLILLNGTFGLTFLTIGDEISNEDRIGGLIDSVNQAGMIASLGQIFALSFLFSNSMKFKSYTIFTAYGICVVSGVLTFSKAALINILLILFAFFLISRFRKSTGAYFFSRRRVRLFILFLFTGMIIVSVSFNNIYSRLSLEQISRLEQFSSLLKGNINSETTTRRSDVGKIAIDYISKNPVIGYGLGTFHSLPSIRLGTHNEFLLVWGESGIIGLILYLLFIYFLWRSSKQFRNLRIKYILLSFTIFLIVSSLVSHNILNTKFLIVIMGLMMAISNNVVLINRASYIKE